MIWRIITYRSLQRSLIKVARSEGCQVKISVFKFLGRSNAILCAATFSKRTLSDCPDHVTSLGFLGSKRWWIFKRLSPYSCCQLQGGWGPVIVSLLWIWSLEAQDNSKLQSCKSFISLTNSLLDASRIVEFGIWMTSKTGGSFFSFFHGK